ncbi:caspase domain-containing protein [Phanerochaete sordida]|uniref:Caspase domain-containing protein n=1 Tax=Phanerochaete sordida TaxID=48140 RepID=A0A9P3FY76_9APHY|nr:caspase domain-containing protein [Phanerochaete sordida]
MSPIPSSVRDRSRDKALLIGLQYGGPQSTVGALKTPHRDVVLLKLFLIAYEGYLEENITVITDDPADERMRPTKARANIVAAIEDFMHDVQPGDRRVFFFAGHGYQIVSRTGTEDDNRDEVILVDPAYGEPVCTGTRKTLDPYMLKEGDPDKKKLEGIITDNYLREKLVDRLPPGARLVAIFDTCHSGTMLDLDHHWKWQRLPRRASRSRSGSGYALVGASGRHMWLVARAYGKFLLIAKRRSSARVDAPVAKPVIELSDCKTWLADAAERLPCLSPVSETPRCLSPVSEQPQCLSPVSMPQLVPAFPRGPGPVVAEVVSISSAMDKELAWAFEDTMLSVLLDILKESKEGSRPKMIKVMERVQLRTRDIRVTLVDQSRGACGKKRLNDKQVAKTQHAQSHQFGSMSPWAHLSEFKL